MRCKKLKTIVHCTVQTISISLRLAKLQYILVLSMYMLNLLQHSMLNLVSVGNYKGYCGPILNLQFVFLTTYDKDALEKNIIFRC